MHTHTYKMAAAGGRPAHPKHHFILFYILYIVCYTMIISLGTCIFFVTIVFFCAHTYLRPFELGTEGVQACLLPWQRDDIAARCSGIRCAVRTRRNQTVPGLTMVGETQLAQGQFDAARQNAMNHIRQNFVKGITSVTDMPNSTKPLQQQPQQQQQQHKVAKKTHAPKQQQQQQQAAMDWTAGRLRNKDV